MSPLITAERLKRFAPGCDADTLAPALQVAAERYDIDTLERTSHLLGQLSVESQGLTRFVENLSYSASRLCQVWPSRFPTLESAQPYARNPEALAERAYGGRLGNIHPGDGFAYRGRGLIQITGRANYSRFGEMLGLGLEAHPELAAEPMNAALLACAYWHDRNQNAAADHDDILAITRAINGGTTGLADRRMQVERARRVLAA